jgi:sugar/nucleoside kinase (ribokinase family)
MIRSPVACLRRQDSPGNGRGDTTIAAYMSWRRDHSPAESLKFAAALISIKMEKPGPFNGSLEEMLD